MRGIATKISGLAPLFVLFIAGAVSSFEDIEKLRIWPLPAEVSHGGRRMYLSEDFKLVTEGSKYEDPSGILKEGFDRMLAVVRLSHVVSGHRNSSSSGGSALLEGLHVIISSSTDEIDVWRVVGCVVVHRSHGHLHCITKVLNSWHKPGKT